MLYVKIRKAKNFTYDPGALIYAGLTKEDYYSEERFIWKTEHILLNNMRAIQFR